MIGIDLIQIKRIESMLERFGKKSLNRFLNEDEIVLSKSNSKTIAGFWAAKEAISKALGVGISNECGFKDITIQKTQRNAPYFTLTSNLVKKFNIKDTSLSITHDGEYAIAVATLEKG